MLAPTRVLASQHYRTLLKRMPDLKYVLLTDPLNNLSRSYITYSIQFLRGGPRGDTDKDTIKAMIQSGECQVHSPHIPQLLFHRLTPYRL